MAQPEIGQPLPRAPEAYSAPEKWETWILAEPGHGPDWRRVFGAVDRAAVWQALADAVARRSGRGQLPLYADARDDAHGADRARGASDRARRPGNL